jgi:predicted component of type VI protein secretion system
MRFRLRYQQHDLALGDGQFVVGRSAGCQLSLDDPLVSRRHAMLVVTRDVVTVEDLESRNGVVVNGQRITAKTTIQPGDKILIGSQELVLLRGRDNPLRETASLPGRGTLPRLVVPADLQPLPTAMVPGGVPGGPTQQTDAIPLPKDDFPADVDADASTVRRVMAFKLIGGVAEKALAMGRADEAERLLSAPLADIMEASRSGKPVSPWLVDVAARLAAKLATTTAKGTWADYVIELYHVQGRPCAAPVVDELNNAFRKVNAIDLVRLRAYLNDLREKQASLGPAERFLLQRIEGLERLAALR